MDCCWSLDERHWWNTQNHHMVFWFSSWDLLFSSSLSTSLKLYCVPQVALLFFFFFLMTVVNLLLPLPQLFWTSARGGRKHFYGSLCTNTWCSTFWNLYLTPGSSSLCGCVLCGPPSYQTVWLLTSQTGKHTFSSTSWSWRNWPDGYYQPCKVPTATKQEEHNGDAHGALQYTLVTRLWDGYGVEAKVPHHYLKVTYSMWLLRATYLSCKW